MATPSGDEMDPIIAHCLAAILENSAENLKKCVKSNFLNISADFQPIS